MIYSLLGKLASIHKGFLVVECGGVGYRVCANARTLSALPPLASEVKLFCHHYVREDQEELFGFLDEHTRSFFELLISISGVGPKTALGVLDLDLVPNIMAAILEKRVDLLSSAPGIGKKTAERIIVELQNKITVPHSEVLTKAMDVNRETEEALLGLGYPRPEIVHALKVAESVGTTVEERLRAALKELGRKK